MDSESLAVKWSCMTWRMAGKRGSEFRGSNKRALSTNKNKLRKGNTVIQTGRGRPMGKRQGRQQVENSLFLSKERPSGMELGFSRWELLTKKTW